MPKEKPETNPNLPKAKTENPGSEGGSEGTELPKSETQIPTPAPEKIENKNQENKEEGKAPTMTNEQIQTLLDRMPADERNAVINFFRKPQNDIQTPVQDVAEEKTDLQKENEKQEQDEKALHEKYLKKYGPGYLTVQKPGLKGQPALQKIFSATAWKNLPEKNGTRDGWKVAVKVPPEVKNLQTKS